MFLFSPNKSSFQKSIPKSRTLIQTHHGSLLLLLVIKVKIILIAMWKYELLPRAFWRNFFALQLRIWYQTKKQQFVWFLIQKWNIFADIIYKRYCRLTVCFFYYHFYKISLNCFLQCIKNGTSVVDLKIIQYIIFISVY